MKRRNLALTLILAIVMIFSMFVPVMAEDNMKGKVVILHTNDMHGSYEAGEKSVGLDGVSALKDYYKGLGASVLLLDAGDFTQGTTLVNFYKGKNAAEYMAAAGYDAVTMGNHEFDFGADALLSNMASLEASGVKVISANALKKGTNEPFYKANTIFELDGVKVGVFGLSTAESQTKASPLSVKDFDFADGADMFKIAEAQVKELKDLGCDIVVCLGHLGVDDESQGRRSTDLINAVTGIDLFIDGHSHTVIEKGNKVKDTLVVSTGSNLANVGVVTYDIEAKSFNAELISAESYGKDYGKYDAELKKLIADDVLEVKAEYSQIIGKTTVDLNGERDPGVRTMETNLGDFAADAYLYGAREYVKSRELDLEVVGAISNGGGIRASIPKGDISKDTLCTVFPFGNTISLVTLKGSQLLEALEASTYSTPTAIGGFPQVSGIEYEINTSVPYENGEQYPDSTYYAPAKLGSRVTIKTVGGKAFDLNGDYTIATNNFLASGGDTYYVLTKAAYNEDTYVIDADALISYVIDELGGTIGDNYKQPQGRVKILGEEKPVVVEEEPVEEEPVAITPIEVEPVVVTPVEEAKPKEERPVASDGIYVVAKGDNLWKIAKDKYGTGTAWVRIYEANKATIANPNKISIGQQLIIK